MKKHFLPVSEKAKSYLFLCLLLTLASSSWGQTKDESAIRDVLQNQQESWNRGHIDEFMQGYWKNDSLMFIGKSGITYGWKQTLDSYKKRYPDTATMGKLKFTLLHLKSLSPEYYFVVGRWHLTRSVGDIGGTFTLLFRKMNGKWYIITDHTS